jgi:lipoprotein-releasing system ATP-binding protein
MGIESKIILRAENIHKVFFANERNKQQLEVLKGIDIEISEGEIVFIVGSSGSGKSTLLHILGTLDTPTSGKVFYKGNDIAALHENALVKLRNKEIGFVFQFHHLLPEFTALENVMIPSLIAGMNQKDAKKNAEGILNEVGLQERSLHKPAELSGGEQQRVAVARALVNNPSIVFADEPTGNLDSTMGEKLQDLFLELNKKRKQTFVIVTHNSSFALSGNRTLQLTNGKIF